MFLSYLGELAGLATSVMWAGTSTFFTLAGRKIGSVVLNRVRLVLALIFLVTTHWILFGDPIPPQAGAYRWMWLSLSGVIGLVLGDAFLFQAFVMIGPRLSMLLMSLAPVIATVISWIFLQEVLGFVQVLGILVTVLGIALVVSDRQQALNNGVEDRNYLRGVLFGLGGATGQALGLVTSKLGLVGGFPALSGNVIRMLSAAIVMWLITLVMGQAGSTIQRFFKAGRARYYVLGGAVVGPFVGVWLSLVAVQYTEVGVASTLMSLAPIFLLPVGRFVFHEEVGWKAILGTMIALGGVAILFLF
jgi:drug/metabolite transporter (DMT)-like permease